MGDGSGSVVVIGAGVSGLVAAKTLADMGRNVVVIEPGPRAGGNQRSRQIGGYTFDIGSFIFFDDDVMFQMFPEAGAACHPASMTAKRITPEGRIHAYPISVRDDFLRQSPIAIARDVVSLLYSRVAYRRRVSAGSFGRYHLGTRIFVRTGLSNYIERMFGVDADHLDYEFSEKRMRWIARSANVRAFAKMLFPKRSAPTSRRSMVRPRAGFETFYDRVVAQLRAQGVDIRFNVPVDRIMREGPGMAVLSADTLIQADQLISTIPLNMTARLCDIPPSDMLQSVTLLTLYVTFSGDLGFNSGILCNFSTEGSWKRLTLHSQAYGAVDGREYFSVEIPVTMGSEAAPEAFDAFVSHARSVGLLNGDAQLVGHDITHGAYPVYALGASEECRRLIGEVEQFGVHLIGRQGRFDYLPTSTVAARDAQHLSHALPS